MFTTIRTLFLGAEARAEERVRKTYSIELIDQKIREAQQGLQAAKSGLASLIQRQRSEEKQIALLEGRVADLTGRARGARDRSGRGDRRDGERTGAQARDGPAA